MPRPKLEPEERRTSHIFVALKRGEKKSLRSLARKRRSSVSTVGREAILKFLEEQGVPEEENR